MSEQATNNPIENEEILSDNLTEDLTKESFPEEIIEKTDESSDSEIDELAQMKDAYLRLMAEYDNYRKRTIKEKADLIKNGGEKVLTGLLPVVDDFQRALENIEKSPDMAAIKEGIELIYNKLISFLQQNGVKAIDSAGAIFDPDLHEAVATVPAAGEEQKGKIIDNLQTGYTLNDKVIRHAKVVVAN
jgi:molecular chaperone GrpE